MSSNQKSILITGCSSGIGLAAAKILHERGYQVIASARKLEDVEKLKAEGLTAIQLDVNDSQSISNAVKQTLDITGGTLYALFNNAGYAQAGALEDITRDLAREQFESNVFGLLELTNAVLPVMRKQGYGRIVNVSSVLGLVAMPYRGIYNASKFAVEGLTDSLRQELYDTNIEVSTIVPGPIISHFRENAMQSVLKNIDVEHSAHRHVYQAMKQSFAKSQSSIPFARGPEAVVKKLIHALESKYPKPRYYVTGATHLLAMLKRLLPARALHWVIMQMTAGERKSS